MKAIFLIFKILCLPTILLFKLAGIIIYGISMLSTKITVPLLTFLIGCFIYCVITGSWRDVWILTSCILVVLLFYLLDGILLGFLKTMEGSLNDFLHA